MRKLSVVGLGAVTLTAAVLGLTLPRAQEVKAEAESDVLVFVEPNKVPFGQEEIQKDLNERLGL